MTMNPLMMIPPGSTIMLLSIAYMRAAGLGMIYFGTCFKYAGEMTDFWKWYDNFERNLKT